MCFLCSKVPVVRATWERDAGFLEFYSDVSDSSIPTLSLGVPNTERGELQKHPNRAERHRFQNLTDVWSSPSPTGGQRVLLGQRGDPDGGLISWGSSNII